MFFLLNPLKTSVYRRSPVQSFNDLEHTIYTSPLKPLSIKGFDIFLEINGVDSFLKTA